MTLEIAVKIVISEMEKRLANKDRWRDKFNYQTAIERVKDLLKKEEDKGGDVKNVL